MQYIKTVLKLFPFSKVVTATDFWKCFRHKLILMTCDRMNTTFTGFLRLPTQYEALSGPVIDFLLSEQQDKSLKIAVLGCSNGSEPYSIASVLKNKHPNLRFDIYAYDLYREVVYKAKTASYEYQEIYCNPKITNEFVSNTFDIEKDNFIVKQDIAKHVHFDVVDALDLNLKEKIGTFDIVYAQNFLVHFKPRIAKMGFINICQLLNSKAVFFIDGIDLDIRQRLTKIYNLNPLDYKINEIHNEAEKERFSGWPLSYWSIESFSTKKREWKRRYSTILIKK